MRKKLYINEINRIFATAKTKAEDKSILNSAYKKY